MFKPQLANFVAVILPPYIEEVKENLLPQEAQRGSEIPIHEDFNNSAGLSPEQPDVLTLFCAGPGNCQGPFWLKSCYNCGSLEYPVIPAGHSSWRNCMTTVPDVLQVPKHFPCKKGRATHPATHGTKGVVRVKGRKFPSGCSSTWSYSICFECISGKWFIINRGTIEVS